MTPIRSTSPLSNLPPTEPVELQAQSHPSTDSSITDHPSNELVLIVIWFETICKQHHCNIAELEPFSASIMPLIETCNQFHCDSCTIQRDLTSFDSTFELANKKHNKC